MSTSSLNIIEEPNGILLARFVFVSQAPAGSLFKSKGKSPDSVAGLASGDVPKLPMLSLTDEFFKGKKRKFTPDENRQLLHKTALTFYLLKLEDVLMFIAASGATYKASAAMGRRWGELKFRGFFTPESLPSRLVDNINVPVNNTYCNAGFFQLAIDVSDINSNVDLLREMEATKAWGNLPVRFITIDMTRLEAEDLMAAICDGVVCVGAKRSKVDVSKFA